MFFNVSTLRFISRNTAHFKIYKIDRIQLYYIHLLKYFVPVKIVTLYIKYFNFNNIAHYITLTISHITRKFNVSQSDMYWQ